MNDNTPKTKPNEKQDWIDVVEQEWGFRPLSCTVDADRRAVVAIFANELNVRGEMKIMGYTIVPQTISHIADHPFNAVRTYRDKPRHRVRTQHTL